MEMALGGQVLFTPHLAPMNRGILATCTAIGARGPATRSRRLREAYADEPFIHVSERSPSTKWTLGSNAVHLTARYDERTGRVLAIAALDNLVKGAAGQMIQCANLMLGLDETAGPAQGRSLAVSVTAAQGFVAAGCHAGIKRRKLRHGAGRDRGPQAGHRRRRLHPEQVRRAAGDARPRSGWRPMAAGRRRSSSIPATPMPAPAPPGMADAEAMSAAAAAALGIDKAHVLVCSTGIIGTPLPMDVILAATPKLAKKLSVDGRRTTRPAASSPPITCQGSGGEGLDLHPGRHGQGLRHDRAEHGDDARLSSPPTPTCRATSCSAS